MDCRKGEQNQGWFRSQRFYRAGGDWYFTTRDHCERGPFMSREEAEGELLLFMRQCRLHTQPLDKTVISAATKSRCDA